MKKSLVVLAAALAVCPAFGQAQAPTQTSASATNGAAVKPPQATPALAVPAAAPGATNSKPDIAELMNAESFTNDTGMIMVRVRPGLWASKYLVTQEDYQKVMGSNPSRFNGPRNPVDSVSWNDAVGFCARLAEVERKAEMLPEGFGYNLPTQAQWEMLLGGATLREAVTSSGATRAGTLPVGSLPANSLGLHDVRGNVWQWCRDPQDRPYRVLRGGAWDTFIEINLRPEFRWYAPPDERRHNFGFRAVLQGVPGR